VDDYRAVVQHLEATGVFVGKPQSLLPDAGIGASDSDMSGIRTWNFSRLSHTSKGN
jgi:hypothetical protein